MLLKALVERYDRTGTGNNVRRLHQEDFCQALGRAPVAKYEFNGTGPRGPSIADMFALVRQHMTARDITRLLDAVIFNIAIGNVDSHAKNYSILLGPGAPQLDPLYDLMSGLAWTNITRNHAQAIGGQRRGRHIYGRHWRRMAEAAGLAARGTVQRVEQVTARLLTLTSYEGGFKFTFADGKTHLNGTGFYYDYKDYQAYLFTGVTGVVINADAPTYGLEGDFATSPVRSLNLGLSASWFDAKVKDVPLRIGGPIIRDVKPTYAPTFQTNAIAHYEWAGAGGTFYIGGDAQYSSSYYYNLRNFSADKFSGYWMFNANAGWRNGRGI